MRGYIDIEAVAQGLGAAVDGVVLGSGDNAEVFRIVALHSGHEGDAHAGSQKRIFAVRFLAASPAGITKDVDIR